MPAPRRPARRHAHHDAPDTASEFQRLRRMPPDAGCRDGGLRDRIIAAWLPMAERLAGTFRDRGEDLEDLRQVAAMGLVKAVDSYDPERGAFESFAIPTIKGELRRHFRDRVWPIHVPRSVQQKRMAVQHARRELIEETGDGREPSPDRLAERTGLTTAEVLDALQAFEAFRSLSTDRSLHNDTGSPTLGDTLASDEDGYERIIQREALKPAIARLPARQQRILYLRFFEGHSQSRIAAELGISQMHVSRLIKATCERLRNETSDSTPDGATAPCSPQRAGAGRPGEPQAVRYRLQRTVLQRPAGTAVTELTPSTR